MNHDRITAIRVKGLRSLADVELTLSELTVLIGPNGAGKSSLVEVCELLRMAGAETTFMDKVASVHGGAAALVRRGAFDRIELEADLDGPDGQLRYTLVLRHQAPYLLVHQERLARLAAPELPGAPRILLMQRDEGHYYLYDRTGASRGARPPGARSILDGELALRARVDVLGDAPGGDLDRMCRALAAIEVHPAVDVRPRWVSHDDLSARGPNVVQGAPRLAVGGKNLSNALLQLRNQRNYGHVLEVIRLGLGDEFEEIVPQPMPYGGAIGIEVRLRSGGSLPLFALSDGQVAYLAQVVIAHLERTAPPSLVVLDEPDLHFHPGLTVRLAQMIEGATESFPVLVATQSDTFLDALSAPAQSAVLCELDEHRATRLSRPDPATLASWLAKYDGLGELRRSGYDQLVFRAADSRPASDP